jgi:hypothetical protein
MDVAATFLAAVGTVVAVWGLWRSEFKALRGEIGALRTEVRGDVNQLATDLRGEMGELRSELRGEIGELRAEMRADSRALGEKMDRVFTELLHHVQQGHPHGPPNQAA